jgi:hypothetical protein
LPKLEAAHIFTNRDNIPGQFMPEQRWRNDHAGVITPAEHLHVGPAGESRLHAYQYVAISDAWYGYRLNLQVFSAIQHGGFHLLLH